MASEDFTDSEVVTINNAIIICRGKGYPELANDLHVIIGAHSEPARCPSKLALATEISRCGLLDGHIGQHGTTAESGVLTVYWFRARE